MGVHFRENQVRNERPPSESGIAGKMKRQIAPGEVLSDKTCATHDPAFDRTRSPYWLPGEGTPTPTLVFIEDNGPTGDRFGTREFTGLGGCPAATDADFPDIDDTYPEAFPPVISVGNFVVHDHG